MYSKEELLKMKGALFADLENLKVVAYKHFGISNQSI